MHVAVSIMFLFLYFRHGLIKLDCLTFFGGLGDSVNAFTKAIQGEKRNFLNLSADRTDFKRRVLNIKDRGSSIVIYRRFVADRKLLLCSSLKKKEFG